MIDYIWKKNRDKFWFFFMTKPIKYLYDFYRFRIIDEKKFLKKLFFKNHKYELDLSNPKTLNEKIQWLKLNDRTELHTKCADKFEVRQIVSENIGEQYLIPLLLKIDNIERLTIDLLPDIPFIIKTNHDSGTCIIVKNKNEIDLKVIKKKLSKALKFNYYYSGKEWQYKNIKPLIIIEKLLMRDNGDVPFDYKVHCIHGVVEMISVDLYRGTPKHKRNWYDINWNRLPFEWASDIKGVRTIQSKEDVERPLFLSEMILLSEKISKFFKLLRVDWYELNSKLYFGELTFHHDSGMKPIKPYEWDLKIGNKLNLDKK